MANAVGHGSQSDRNIIVQVTFDKGGRVLNMRDPRGNLTTYTYDKLNRRTSKLNPLNKQWSTNYSDLLTGGTRTVTTYPGINGGSSYNVQRDHDRLGRLTNINYGDVATTPNVTFAYNAAGDRYLMSEFGASGKVRETTFNYNPVHRLQSVNFDTDGNGTANHTISYEYDLGGLRTLLSINNERSATYTYDTRGRMATMNTSVGDATFVYDAVNRINEIQRAGYPESVNSKYKFDIAGSLNNLHHYSLTQSSYIHQFDYQVDGRGYRKQAYEKYFHLDETIVYGYDHVGRINSATYKDGPPTDARFPDTYSYTYDLSGNRLSEVYTSYWGTNNSSRSFQYNTANQLTSEGVYTYTYDGNGNLLSKKQGATVIDSYTWDRANRTTSVTVPSYNTTYKYDGLSNRISKTENGVVREHWLDMQPPLTQIVADLEQATPNPYMSYFLHSPYGLFGEEIRVLPNWGNNDDITYWDGLGSVRETSVGTRRFDPYGNFRDGTNLYGSGVYNRPFGFTGEYTDDNNLIYLRARHYNPNLGMMLSLDPFEGTMDRPMSLNGYSYVEGNPVNWTDPTGNIIQPSNVAVTGGCSAVSTTGSLFNNNFLQQNNSLDGINKIYDRVCGYLCHFLIDDSFTGLDRGCKDRLRDTICPLLCNAGPFGEEVTLPSGQKEIRWQAEQEYWDSITYDNSYKGPIQRFKEFINNKFNMQGKERSNHRESYNRTREHLGREYNTWSSECDIKFNNASQVREFNGIVKEWIDKPLPFAATPNVGPSSVPQIPACNLSENGMCVDPRVWVLVATAIGGLLFGGGGGGVFQKDF